MSNIIGDRFSVTDDPDESLNELIRHEIHEIHTSQPCEVVKFNKSEGTVSIKLGVLRDITGEAVDVFTLSRVPVIYPCTSKFKMTFPLDVGDTGLAVFCESSIDRWLTRPSGSNRGYQNPKDVRMHDYSDAVFIPGLKRYAESDEVSDDLCIEFGESKITLTEDGKFCVNTSSGEFLDVLISALEQISSGLGGLGAQDIALLKLMKCGGVI